MRARIVATGSAVPRRVLRNADLERMVATSDEWIVARTGIRERRIVDDGVASSDLGTEAAQAALVTGGWDPAELDLILVATCTPDMPLPSTACLIQRNLKASRAIAFDLAAACSGFLYGLSVADLYVRSGACRRVLVVGTEVMSSVVDWTDRGTCILFGDGAGAVLIEPSDDDRGILSTHLHSDGELWDLVCVPGGGSRVPASAPMLADRQQYVKMKGNETFKVAVKTLEATAREALEANKLEVGDVDLFIPHQANVRIVNAVMERLGLKKERAILNIDRYGNTSAASIPLALDEAVRTGRVTPGSRILMVAFGSGLTWASAMIRW
ncbi:MAG TPA: beta-ketoacyl-ACP synthase III [Nitrospirales bacterium]|nr:beta-ketoacyl-ACP synthase III [Nitrospirales bacterium]